MPEVDGVWPYLEPELREFQQFVRTAVADCILPYVDQWEAQRQISRSGWGKLASLGLLDLPHTGAGFLRSAVFLEELGALGYAGVRASLAVHSYMAAAYVNLCDTPGQRIIRTMASGANTPILALAITEASSGSDLANIQTTAVRQPDGSYRISGGKHYVVNAMQADLIVVLVRTGLRPETRFLRGCSFAIIGGCSAGIVRRPQEMLGWRSADIGRLEFDDVLVAEDSFIGARGQALRQMTKAIDFERLVAGLLAVGGARYCLEQTRKSVNERRVGGTPLGRNSAIQHRLAEMQSDFELVCQYARHAAWLQSKGRLDRVTAAVVKLKATELSNSISVAFLQYEGAHGYLAESNAARVYRDSPGATIAAGASELMRQMVYDLT